MRKHAKWDPVVAALRRPAKFVAFAVEATGGLVPEGHKLLKLFRSICDQNRLFCVWQDLELYTHLCRQLSVTLMQGNAAIMRKAFETGRRRPLDHWDYAQADEQDWYGFPDHPADGDAGPPWERRFGGAGGGLGFNVEIDADGGGGVDGGAG